MLLLIFIELLSVAVLLHSRHICEILLEVGKIVEHTRRRCQRIRLNFREITAPNLSGQVHLGAPLHHIDVLGLPVFLSLIIEIVSVTDGLLLVRFVLLILLVSNIVLNLLLGIETSIAAILLIILCCIVL